MQSVGLKNNPAQQDSPHYAEALREDTVYYEFDILWRLGKSMGQIIWQHHVAPYNITEQIGGLSLDGLHPQSLHDSSFLRSSRRYITGTALVHLYNNEL